MAILNGGRILKHTTPIDATKEIEGTIWHKLAEGNFGGFFGWPNLTLTPTGGFMGMPASEKPGEDFEQGTPQLDDVYFIALKQDEPVLA